MALTKQNRKAIEQMLEEIPEPDYESLCNFLGMVPEERKILELRYRQRDFKPTREFVAEELGMSPSTLDRHVKSLLKRIDKFAQKLLCMSNL